MVVSHNIGTLTDKQIAQEYTFERYLYPEFYDSYNDDETPEYIEQSNDDIVEESTIDIIEEPIQPLVGPMDSAWPMCGRNLRHTGLSPYSTANNPGEEKWWFYLNHWCQGSPVIDEDGVVYFGSYNGYFYAINPDGTEKWKCLLGENVNTYPAIAEDGTIYVGTTYFVLDRGNFLYAINPNGTLKWKYKTGEMYISPAIGEDGTVYSTNGGSCIVALYPNNGTVKWSYKTDGAVISSPAIDDNGILYCGSNDDYVYALYAFNGKLKWKFKTGAWVHGIPTIADDRTIYIGSDDGYLYAFYPNGTVKWTCKIGYVWASPALDKDGNLYVGVWQKKFYSISPNGTIIWSVNLTRQVWGQSAVISDDGTIYFGTSNFEGGGGGYFHALNSNGTIKYILYRTEMFLASPAIGEDGTVYFCTRGDRWNGEGFVFQGRLHALGELDPDAPLKPVIDGPKQIKVHEEYNYTFKAISPLGKDFCFWIEWGDKGIEEWLGPYISGTEITVSHKWVRGTGSFKIMVKARDIDNRWSPWGEFEVKFKTKSIDNNLFLRFLERYPLLNRLLDIFVK